jgi:putative oxidoreductase
MLTLLRGRRARAAMLGGFAMTTITTGTRSSSSSPYYIPALGRIYAALDPYMLPLLRIALGAILIPHGCQKFFGWFGGMGFTRFSALFEQIGYKPGAFWVALVAGTELIGGLMLIFGVFTRFAALAVVIFMINAVWVTSARGFFWTAGGSEFSILILAVALVFLVRGGGYLSVDQKMGREL